MRQDAALEVSVELVLDEQRQLGAGAGLGVGEEIGRGRRMLPCQMEQRGLLGAVPLAVERQ